MLLRMVFQETAEPRRESRLTVTGKAAPRINNSPHESQIVFMLTDWLRCVHAQAAIAVFIGESKTVADSADYGRMDRDVLPIESSSIAHDFADGRPNILRWLGTAAVVGFHSPFFSRAGDR